MTNGISEVQLDPKDESQILQRDFVWEFLVEEMEVVCRVDERA